MITLSFVISLLSLALAGGLTFVVMRMRRDERDRSNARVSALSRMAEADFLPEPEPFLPEPEPAAAASLASAETSSGLFAEPTPTSPWGARLAIAGVIGILLVMVFAITLLRSPGVAPGTSQAAQAVAPLELVALSHTQHAGSLTVSGRVQNPRGGQAVPSLTATVFLFGADGSFLTSGRSPLETETLDAGAASAFDVTIPVNGAVARYRVSFRDSSGHAVAHVDRRHDAALARNE